MGPEASALSQGSGSQITDWGGVEQALRKVMLGWTALLGAHQQGERPSDSASTAPMCKCQAVL